ncbi:MAG TPA: diguanylate cyclase, partial [Burkholderiales bacterium]|nr:diguanylate cyclase [Burkholderiales bacterium]
IALRAVGQLLREQFRVSDYGCRYGGEEFTVVMPEAPLEAASKRAENLREAAGRLALQQGGRALGPITISVGLATMPQHGETPQALLQAADAALYQAKQAGRNRVVISGGSME